MLNSILNFSEAEFKSRLMPRASALPQQILTSTFLQGIDGMKVQAVYPASCLLDLQKLQAGGTDWRALAPKTQARLLQKLKLKTCPAVPGITDFPFCIDTTYLAQDWVFIEAGDGQQLFRFSSQEYLNLLQKAHFQGDSLENTAQEIVFFENFSQPLDSTRPNLDAPFKDEKEILSAIEAITQKRVRARLSEAIEIAPLPLSTQKLLALKNKPDVSSLDLAQVIETDPSLASQVISWANSPYYGAPGSIRSIQDAVVRVLGFDLTMNLALGLALSKQIRLPKDGVHGHKNFWQDSILRALLVEKLVKKMPPLARPYIGLAYLAGLLYNFGYLVLAEVFPPYFSLYCRYQEANPRVHPMYLERLLFGITREQIASYLFTTWGLPTEMCLAIRQQHNPKYTGEAFKYANLLHLAAEYLQPNWEQNLTSISAAVFDRLQLEPEAALEARQELDRVSNTEIVDLVSLLTTRN